MTEIADELRIAVPAEAVRAALRDPALLARVIPDCESVEAVGPDRLRYVLATRAGFLTVRADVDARIDAACAALGPIAGEVARDLCDVATSLRMGI